MTKSNGRRKTRFGDVVRNVNVKVGSPVAGGIQKTVGLDDLDSGSLALRRFGDPTAGTTFTKHFLPGQVLFGKRRAYQRKVAVPDFEGVCSGDILVFEAMPECVLPELLPFIAQSEPFFDHALRTSRGSLSPRTSWKDLAAFELELPPLDEQRRMAALLWSIEHGRRAAGAVVATLRTLRLSLLEQEFQDRGVQESLRFAEVGEWLSGGTPARSEAELWSGPIPWVSPKDMKVATISDAAEHISEQAADALRLAPKGSTLFVTRGMILAHSFPVAIAGEPVAFNQDIKVVIPGPAVRPRYLFFWLVANTKRCLQLVTDSTHGTKRLATDVLQGLMVPTPELAAQDATIKLLDRCEEAITAVEKHLVSTKLLQQSMLHKLLPATGGTT